MEEIDLREVSRLGTRCQVVSPRGYPLEWPVFAGGEGVWNKLIILKKKFLHHAGIIDIKNESSWLNPVQHGSSRSD